MTAYEGLETPTNDSGYSSLASSQNDLITSSSDLQVRVDRKKYSFFVLILIKFPLFNYMIIWLVKNVLYV